ncbi:uncharacterized protein EAE98_002844 [Botrytis deweyae]|uniref:BAH domain-containing protein n=2 Tax=Botrytis TaxID=33196 RepID=A0A4Z1JEV3_9HELO|nr:uncharacterized protein EAE98_002844 [Botrytis deweyae]KAF7934799.1 hypothetical protein EAE98_002844 [Botrytis deweyae]KAF7942443.1 hypothetical protein EAE99_000493 [Botrytis elliptica]TGO72311.1 hypothetical protein BELL_0468g00010 [Botrytis elliptica]
MAPKHGLNGSSSSSNKRMKTESSEPGSMSSPAAVQEAISFEIKIPLMDLDKKGKESKQNAALRALAEEHISPFQGFNAPEDELNYHYTVVPNTEWAAMRKYNNFIIQGDTYKNNQFVYVKGKTETGTQPRDFWIARILQVRAKDPQHVYALVAWMYWPEELPATAKAAGETSASSGRRKYHGNSELIASNYLDVVDVLTFAGKLDVERFSEDLDDYAVSDPDPSKCYWRQTFCQATQRLSDLPVYCICNGHYNPDKREYEHICDNRDCQTLYHSECLVEDVLVKRYHEEYPQNKTATNGIKPKDKKNKNGKSKQKIYSKEFKGEFAHDQDEQTPPMIKITDKRSTPHTVTLQRVACPKCSTLFE